MRDEPRGKTREAGERDGKEERGAAEERGNG